MEHTRPWQYDIHGLVRIASSVALPDLDFFIDEGAGGEPADLVILPEGALGGVVTSENAARLVAANGVAALFRGRRAFVHVPARLQRSPYALFTNVVEPLLAWSLSRRGHALVHAACIAVDGDGVLLTAPPGGGKTAACLSALSDPAVSFLADDTVILTPDGRVMAFPKALKLSRATLRLMHAVVGLSRSTRLVLAPRAAVHARGAQALARTVGRRTSTVASLATVIHRVVPPPRLSLFDAAADVPLSRDAPLTRVLLLDRHATGPSIEPVSVGEAQATLARNSAAARRQSLDSSLVTILEDRGMLNGDEIHLPPTARCERLRLTNPTELRARLLDRGGALAERTA